MLMIDWSSDVCSSDLGRSERWIVTTKDDKLVLALPKGRILGEVMPILARAGVEPEPAFDDPDSRQLRFATSDPRLEIVRVRAFDVATFVAFGAAHFGVAGNDEIGRAHV